MTCSKLSCLRTCPSHLCFLHHIVFNMLLASLACTNTSSDFNCQPRQKHPQIGLNTCYWRTEVYTECSKIACSERIFTITRNVGMPKGRPTWWPPPPSRWCWKSYDNGEFRDCPQYFRGWWKVFTTVGNTVKTTVLFLTVSGPKFMKFLDDVGDPS